MPAPERRTQAQSLLRTFLAIELPDTVRTRLAVVERDFSRYLPILKWSGPDLLHITIRFLGGVPENRMPLVMDAAHDAAARVQPFRLTLSSLGAFPSIGKPRVIWVGLDKDGGYEALQQLFSEMESELAARGFPPEERAFAPHITLARTRDSISETERRELGTALAEVASHAEPAGVIPVRELIVMRSKPGPRGPSYTALAHYPLIGIADRHKEDV